MNGISERRERHNLCYREVALGIFDRKKNEAVID
jgi:hypothetical protein